MMKHLLTILFIVFVVDSQAMAGEIDLAPSLDSIHIAELIFPNQPDAADKAQKALIMQTGFDKQYAIFSKNLNHEAYVYGNDAKVSTEKFIDEDTPLNSKVLLIGVGVAYTLASSKSYTQNLGEPLMSGVRQNITVGPNKIMTSIIYTF